MVTAITFQPGHNVHHFKHADDLVTVQYDTGKVSVYEASKSHAAMRAWNEGLTKVAADMWEKLPDRIR